MSLAAITRESCAFLGKTLPPVPLPWGFAGNADREVTVATLVKTAQGRWKSVIRRRGWPAVAKTFRTKRDAADWGRATEEAMVRGVFLQRASVHRLGVKDALARYLAEVTPTKRRSTQYRERGRAATLVQHLGGYSLVTLTPEIIASFRDARLAAGKSANTVRLELALLSHLYAIAMRE